MTETSTEAALLVGVAEAMVAATTRQPYAWKPTAAYTVGDGIGITIDLAPASDLPGVTITEYPVSADVVGGDEVLGVQFRIVGKNRAQVKDVISDLVDLFHARWGGSLGDIKLIQSQRSSGANLGQDANGRLVRTENYYLTIYRG